MTFLKALKRHVVAREFRRHVGDDERIAQVRLVRAIFQHRLGIGDQREFLGHRPAAAEFLEDAAQHRLDRREDILLRDEAHLDIELIEFAGAAVGARVLVAETGRDLEIAVEARHHDELLELLRRLRQRIELAGMQARGHEKVARALRARGGQDRRLELEEALRLHPRAQAVDDLAAQHDVLVQLFAAQIEEAVFEPHVLGIVLLAEDRQRQFGGRAQNLDRGRHRLRRGRSAFPDFRCPPGACAPCRRSARPIPSAASRPARKPANRDRRRIG